MADFDLGLPPDQPEQQPSAPAAAQAQGRPQNDFDVGLPPDPQQAPAQSQAQSWAQYARDPSHPMWQRVGAATIEEGKAIGKGLYNTASDLFSGRLARDLGNQTLGYGDLLDDPRAADRSGAELAGRSLNAASIFGPTGDVVAAGMPGAISRRGSPVVPSAADLYGVADRQYDAGRALDGLYTEEGVGNLAALAKQKLYQDGIDETVAPKTHATLSRLGDPRSHVPGGVQDTDTVAASIDWVDNHRRVLSQIARGNDPTERKAASSAISDVKNFLEDPPQDAIHPGSEGIVQQAADLYRTAGGNWGAAKRSDKVTGQGDYAQYRAASAHSGANYDNNLRQSLRPLFDPTKPQRLAGFNQEEKDAIEGVIKGDFPRNAARKISDYLGGGGGWGAATEGLMAGMAGAAGHEAFGPAGITTALAIPAAGAAIKGVQNKLAKNAIEGVGELTRKRSPLYQERVKNPSFELQPNAPGIAAVKAIAPANSDDNGQRAYAKGGTVKGHQHLVDRLMKLAEQAKKAEQKHTEPILNMPDDVVATALAKAKEAI